jgi:low temperature requirement protein LtrA
MSIVIQNFRKWWQPPRKTSEREEERTVTFLELFYDLVYVVVIAELSHGLAGHIGLQGLLEFAMLFVLVWFAWLNGAIYHDLHGNNDIRTRVFTFLQMFTVAAMAVFAHNAFGGGSVGFALSFAAYQLIITYLWWRTGVHDPLHRPLSTPYVYTYLFSTILFLVSALVPPPWRFYLWGFGTLISVLMPLVSFIQRPSDPEVLAEHERSMRPGPSIVERFGLFTIIVLGEVIVGVVRGVAGHHHLTWEVGITAALGMLLAIGIWWLYFDFVSQHVPFDGLRSGVWIYLHLFMTMSIVATGAAVLNVVEHAGEPMPSDVRWLLVGAIAATLIAIALLMGTIQLEPRHLSLYRRAAMVTALSAALSLALGFLPLGAIPLLMILVLLMLLPVFYGFKVWVVALGAEEIPIA